MKKKYTARYIFERIYPYCFALIITACCWRANLKVMINEEGYSNLLNGLITLDSIIVSFLGTVTPVILSMKSESKFVKYVFANDTDNLFVKYLKCTLVLGFANVLITLLLHVKAVIPVAAVEILYYMWVFVTIAFLMSTYRSMSRMITLIFTKDEEYMSVLDIQTTDSSNIAKARKSKLEKKYRNKRK